MNLRDMLPSDSHRALLAVLERDARGRLKALRRSVVNARMQTEFGIVVSDRQLRKIRPFLVKAGFPCYAGPGGYYYGVEIADLHDARAYNRKKAMAILEERHSMGAAYEQARRIESKTGEIAQTTFPGMR